MRLLPARPAARHAIAATSAALLGAALLAGCGSSSGGGAGNSTGDSTAGGNRTSASSAGTGGSASTGNGGSKDVAWPVADACTLIDKELVTKALGETLNAAPAPRDGAYGPTCEYYSAVASPIASIQAFPVADMKTYTTSLSQRDAVTPFPGLGDSAFLSLPSASVADAVLYVFDGKTAFSVQVSVYGGDGSWTSQRATAAAKSIAQEIIN